MMSSEVYDGWLAECLVKVWLKPAVERVKWPGEELIKQVRQQDAYPQKRAGCSKQFWDAALPSRKLSCQSLP